MPTSSSAQQDGDPVKDGAVGLTAGLCTLVYTPVKIVYAAVGLPLAGVVFVLSGFNGDASGRLATAAIGGDYVVTPDHIMRRKTLRLIGGP